MKLSISTGCFYFLSLERTLNIIKKAGFENVEILAHWKDNDWEVGQNTKGLSYKDIFKITKNYGLEVSAIHDPSGAIYDLNDSIVTSKTLEYKNNRKKTWLITHLPHISQTRKNWWTNYYPKAIEQYESLQKNYNICIENMSTIPNYEICINTCEELLELCKKTNTYINLDLIHLIENGQDLRKSILMLNDKIKNIHISGINCTGRVSFNESEIPILNYLQYLNLNNMEAITIETKFDVGLDDNDYIKQCKLLYGQLKRAIKVKKMPTIPFSQPTFLGKELEYIKDSVQNNKISGNGLYTQKCKNWFKKYYNSKFTVITTSCTHALELAANVCDISPEDEVIMPSFTFTATANAFINAGARIRFVDIKQYDMNIDENLIESAITNKTKAIVVVHYAGIACNMDKIMQLAKKYNLFVIEDAAQAILCETQNRKLGTIGDIGCFSFHATKNITMGEGGAFVLNNVSLKDRAISISDNGIDRRNFLSGKVNRYEWTEKGASYMASDLNAAFLFAQLQRVKEITKKRLKMWNLYNELLMPLQKKGYLQISQVPKEVIHNAHIFFIKTDCRSTTQNLQLYLKNHNIMATYHYTPLHLTTPGKKYGEMVTDDNYTTVESYKLLRLPLYYSIKRKDIYQIAKAIYNFYGVNFNA